MADINVNTLDLNFQGISGVIASYLIPHANGVVLIECGPGSTQKTLEKKLHSYGYSLRDITDLLLTHIHLDHAGAAGWLASHGVRVHVHYKGAPHMIDPTRLLSSASRIYGDKMDILWGKFLPVPEESLVSLSGDDEVVVGDLRFRTLDTPGHANHHLVYMIDDICFSGDVGGVRLAGTNHLVLPMPPPEFHLERWRSSVDSLKELKINRIAPTHYGIFNDPPNHLKLLEDALNNVENWAVENIADEPSIDDLKRELSEWALQSNMRAGLSEELSESYEVVNPTWMSAEGIYRYWRKYRAQTI